jgi:hypothetical protein
MKARLQLFSISFISLFLELMVIRWVPSILVLVAYYANFLLISSFLGLGLGALWARDEHRLFKYFPPFFFIFVFFLVFVRHVPPPQAALEFRFFAVQTRPLSYLVLVGVFVLNVLVFVPLGNQIGRLFQQLPVLEAYGWDLGGSLLGTVVFGIFSYFYFSPILGISLVMLIYLLHCEIKELHGRLLWLAMALLWIWHTGDRAMLWSPYHYITVTDGTTGTLVREPMNDLRTMKNPPIYTVRVNQDFIQSDGTLDPKRYDPIPSGLFEMRSHYGVAYALHPRPRRVLVLGSGGGMDAESALLSGAQHVDAVDIDPGLIQLAKRFNASGVYDDSRVHVHADDARAFLRRATRGYDVVVFGFLDSQALFSSMSNIRLDGFVYTVESIRSAFHLLSEDGVLTMSFAVDYNIRMASKLFLMLKEAAGQEPLMYGHAHNLVLCVARHRWNNPPAAIGPYRRLILDPVRVSVPMDDWPYLYLFDRRIPSDYLIVMGSLFLVLLMVLRWINLARLKSEGAHFLFLGAGFLLLQTKGIVDCALYFGNTWFVVNVMITGVLLMVLAANLVAAYRKYSPVYYVVLFLTLLVIYAVPKEWVLDLSWIQRLAWCLFVLPLPIFFAGLVFSTSFQQVHDPSAAFGANLIGATIGGFMEYLGMVIGYHQLTPLLGAVYLLSLFFLLRWRLGGTVLAMA